MIPTEAVTVIPVTFFMGGCVVSAALGSTTKNFCIIRGYV